MKQAQTFSQALRDKYTGRVGNRSDGEEGKEIISNLKLWIYLTVIITVPLHDWEELNNR